MPWARHPAADRTTTPKRPWLSDVTSSRERTRPTTSTVKRGPSGSTDAGSTNRASTWSWPNDSSVRRSPTDTPSRSASPGSSAASSARSGRGLRPRTTWRRSIVTPARSSSGASPARSMPARRSVPAGRSAVNATALSCATSGSAAAAATRSSSSEATSRATSATSSSANARSRAEADRRAPANAASVTVAPRTVMATMARTAEARPRAWLTATRLTAELTAPGTVAVHHVDSLFLRPMNFLGLPSRSG